MATEQYTRLTESPQTKINRADLSLEERTQLRQLRVTQQANHNSSYSGHFTSVYYLEGDERAAAKKFVEENREVLEQIDFTHPDSVQRSLEREVYDWVLHFLGERELRKYRNVVYERRRGGTEWLIDRERFEQDPENRYGADYRAAVVRSSSLEAIYQEYDDVITESELKAHDAIDGGGHNVLEYYRVAGPFDCEPTTIDDELAVTKRD